MHLPPKLPREESGGEPWGQHGKHSPTPADVDMLSFAFKVR